MWAKFTKVCMGVSLGPLYCSLVTSLHQGDKLQWMPQTLIALRTWARGKVIDSVVVIVVIIVMDTSRGHKNRQIWRSRKMYLSEL